MVLAPWYFIEGMFLNKLGDKEMGQLQAAGNKATNEYQLNWTKFEWVILFDFQTVSANYCKNHGPSMMRPPRLWHWFDFNYRFRVLLLSNSLTQCFLLSWHGSKDKIDERCYDLVYVNAKLLSYVDRNYRLGSGLLWSGPPQDVVVLVVLGRPTIFRKLTSTESCSVVQSPNG